MEDPDFGRSPEKSLIAQDAGEYVDELKKADEMEAMNDDSKARPNDALAEKMDSAEHVNELKKADEMEAANDDSKADPNDAFSDKIVAEKQQNVELNGCNVTSMRREVFYVKKYGEEESESTSTARRTKMEIDLNL